MFKITSTQPINWTWASFALVKGENTFPSRQSVPAELWPKLKRFRDLEILEFDGEPAAGDDKIVLEELTELHLFQMSKADLAELAKANGLTVAPAEGLDEPSKKLLLDALVAKLPAPPASEDPKVETQAVSKGKAPKGGQQPVGPVTVG